MSSHFLELDDDKTRLILGNPKRLSEVQYFDLPVGNAKVKPPPTQCQNPGGDFGSLLALTAVPYYILCLAAIHDYLPMELAHRCCISLVISRFTIAVPHCQAFRCVVCAPCNSL